MRSRPALGPRGLALLFGESRENVETSSPLPPSSSSKSHLHPSSIKLSLLCLLYILRRRLALFSLSSLSTRPEPVAARSYLESKPFQPKHWHLDCWDATDAAFIDLKNSKLAKKDREIMLRHRSTNQKRVGRRE